MVRKYTTLLIVSFVWTGLNAQTEFAPTGAEWHYCYASGNIIYSHLNHTVSEKDTTVEENNCRVLKQYNDNSNIASEKYILNQKEGKIYYYYQNQFNLLFDFDAEVNDTIEFAFIYKKRDNFPSLSYTYTDTIMSARFEVESITTNAQNLKTFRTKILDEDRDKVFDTSYFFPYTYTYTEKIGWHSEFMPKLDNGPNPDVEIFRWLRCYSDADFSYVSNEWAATSLPCNYSIAMDISTPEDESIKIYPNPFSDNICVFSHNGGYLEIIDISGKVVYYSKLSNGANKISAGHLLKGIYLVKIQNKDNSIQAFKIVKS
jgi:hypothetical protein